MVKDLAYFKGLGKNILEFISGKFCQLSGSKLPYFNSFNPPLTNFRT
jgi:hypothetical protein